MTKLLFTCQFLRGLSQKAADFFFFSSNFKGSTQTLYKQVYEYTSKYTDQGTRLYTNNVTSRINAFNVSSSSTKPYTHGYDLAERVKNKCGTFIKTPLQTRTNQAAIRLHAVLETSNKRLQLCPVWKVSTTFIRRLFLIKDDPQYQPFVNPYKISFGVSTPALKAYISGSPDVQKFLFVRNPYSRVFSCYVDKLVAPNPIYWTGIGARAIRMFREHASSISLKCGHDLSFSEFVKYVATAVDYKKPGTQMDPHFMPVQDLCKPCTVKYDFIGKLETFTEDYPVLIKALNLTRSNAILDLLEEEGDELSAVDAIADSVHTPYTPEFKGRFTDCMRPIEIYQRSWRKMQIRGLIGTEPLPIDEEKATNITEKEMFELAKVSRKKSSREERMAFKTNQFLKFYRELDMLDLERLRLAYYNDFRLFGYDDRPDYLFHAETET